jgi:hypothetical protein
MAESCAKCNRNSLTSSDLSIIVYLWSNWGHRFCRNCVDKELRRHRSFLCPKCNQPITHEKLSEKTIDETEVERDFRIRRKVMNIFNKQIEDFQNISEIKKSSEIALKLFQDYEEMREDIIFNLVHSIDVDIMNNRIKEYERENLKLITERKSQKEQEEKQCEIKIREEQELQKIREKEITENYILEKQQKKEHARQVNELMLGDIDKVTIPPVSNMMAGAMGIKINTQQQTIRPISINHVQIVLSQRSLPKVILKESNEYNNNDDDDANDNQMKLKLIDQAGGYDYANYRNRNWSEIISCLSVLMNETNT